MNEMSEVNARPADVQHAHAVVWIDHLTAKIFPMGHAGVGQMVMHAHPSSAHLHHKANVIGDGRAGEDKSFLPTVAESLRFCREILILGPGTEKVALLHYLQE